jgi:hypothetical protein
VFWEGYHAEIQCHLQRFQVPNEFGSSAPSTSSSYGPSNAELMSQMTQMNDTLQSMDQRMRLIETDVAQIKLKVWTTLQNTLSEDR